MGPLHRCAVARVVRASFVAGVIALFPRSAEAQLTAPTVVSGTLMRLWGDPPPGGPGAPRLHVAIVTGSGSSTEVRVPESVVESLGGLEALVGRTVTATLAPSAAEAGVSATAAPPTVAALRLTGQVRDAYAPNEGVQRWVAIPCRFADRTSSPVSPAYLQELLGSGPATLGEYWSEVSYGKVTVVGQALPWRTMSRNQSAYVADKTGDGVPEVDFTLLSSDCLDAADADIDFSMVAGVLFVFNDAVGCCAWGGGLSITRDGVSKLIGATYLPPGWGVTHNVVAHEMGHAFGLPHLRDVGNTGPRWDIMASGATCTPSLPVGCRAVHTSAPHKDQLGWIPAERRFTPSPGVTDTVLLESLALPPSQNAYLAAVIPLGKEQLVVESRYRRGYDAGVPGDAVVIYRVDPTTFERTAIVDADGNGDRNDAGAMWVPGETYTEPSTGVVVRVDAAAALGHVVTVSRPASAPPAHTSCLTAREVTILPLKETVLTDGVPLATDLPHATCAPASARALWYRVTAPADGFLSGRADGSTPSAAVTFWRGACAKPAMPWQSFCDGSTPAPTSFASDFVTAGEVVYVAFTAGAARGGSIAVDLSFRPASRSTCVTSVTPSATNLPVGGGTVTFTVGAPAACVWRLFDNVDWITALGPTTVTGPGTVSFAVAANAGPGRGHAFWLDSIHVTVTQDGCAAGDDDCDGLATAWEREFGLDPLSGVGPDGAGGDPDGDGVSNAQERAQQTHPRGTFTRYFAEGATGAFFNARLALANPGATPVRALLRFLTSSGVAATLPVTLAAQQRVSIDPEALPGLSAAEFATVVDADGLLVVDRHMQWGGVGYGAHAETAIVTPSRVWYLAEGSTVGPFALFYLLQNPSASETATVRVRYLLPSGTPLEKTYEVGPSSRFNIWVDEERFDPHGHALASTDVSAVIEVTAGPAIIVERAMYLSRPGEVFSAGHESAGVVAPATTWFLAEGATGGYFDEFVLIANPDSRPASVEARYLLPDGTVHSATYAVAPFSRFNIWLDEEHIPGAGRVLADTAVSVTLRSTNDVPIVVERAMWWPGTSATWQEAHNSPGAVASGTRWALAEGEVGGPADADTYVLIANVSSSAGQVRVTLLFEDATTVVREFAVAPQSRFNVWVREEFPQARGRRFGTLVESLGSVPAQVVVERAMYGNALGVPWAAGTNALAVRLSP